MSAFKITPILGVSTAPYKLTNSGYVLFGYSNEIYNLKTEDMVTILAPAGSYPTDIATINNLGEVIGYDSSGGTEPCFEFSAGTPTALNITPPSNSPIGLAGYESYVNAGDINNAGTILGSFWDDNGYYAFVYDGSTVTFVDDPEGDYTTYNGPFGSAVHVTTTDAVAINDSGEVIGDYHTINSEGTSYTNQTNGFIYNDGSYIPIYDRFAGTTGSTSLLYLNDVGEIIGSYDNTATAQTGYFLYDAGEVNKIVISKKDLPDADSNSLVVTGINDLGEIVGYFESDGAWHGFIDIDGKDAQFDYDYSSTQQVDTYITGVNDLGQIVGYAVVVGQSGDHSFTADPTQDNIHFSLVEGAGGYGTLTMTNNGEPVDINGTSDTVGIAIDPTMLLPNGVYDLVYYQEDKRNAPCLLVNFKFPDGRTFIEIHKGNSPGDSEGCIVFGDNFVRQSGGSTGGPGAYGEMLSYLNFIKGEEGLALNENGSYTFDNAITLSVTGYSQPQLSIVPRSQDVKQGKLAKVTIADGTAPIVDRDISVYFTISGLTAAQSDLVKRATFVPEGDGDGHFLNDWVITIPGDNAWAGGHDSVPGQTSEYFQIDTTGLAVGDLLHVQIMGYSESIYEWQDKGEYISDTPATVQHQPMLSGVQSANIHVEA